MGKRGKTMEQSWEKTPENMGKPWENMGTHGKTMGKTQENMGKPWDKPWEDMGKQWDKQWESNWKIKQRQVINGNHTTTLLGGTS